MSRSPFQVLIIPFRKNKNGSFEYAMLKRSDEPYWQTIAGGGEDNETPIEAAKRETLEETSIPKTAKYYSLKTIASIPVYHFSAQDVWPKDLYVIPGYYFAVDCSDFKIKLSFEHTEHKWLEYEDALKLPQWDTDKTAVWELNERLLNNDLRSAE